MPRRITALETELTPQHTVVAERAHQAAIPGPSGVGIRRCGRWSLDGPMPQRVVDAAETSPRPGEVADSRSSLPVRDPRASR